MPEDSPQPEQQSAARLGLILGLISAVCYSTTNLALRALKPEQDDFAWEVWVTAMKALPTVVLATVLLIRRKSKGKALYPTTKPILPLILAALLIRTYGSRSAASTCGLASWQ